MIFDELSKLLGRNPVARAPLRRNETSKHASGRQRPANFDARRKTRRRMAKLSRRLNRGR